MNPKVLDRIHDALARHRLPGLAVAADHDGEELFAAGFGHLDPDRSRELDADTPFGVASLTKFLTAAAIMRLYERGRLSLDAPLSAFYPSLAFAADGSVSLHHLLTHSAGLPGLPCRFRARDIDAPENRSGGSAQTGLAPVASDAAPAPELLTADDLAAEINRLAFTPLARPGELLSYCNEGFCLLGGIIEQMSGQAFAHAAREWVLEPLQMTRSFIGPEGMPGDDELALPLLRVAQGFRRGRFWQAPLFYAAGGMVASARDVVRLIRSLGAGQALLSEDSRRQMVAPQMRVASRPGEHCAYGFGLEWHRVDQKPRSSGIRGNAPECPASWPTWPSRGCPSVCSVMWPGHRWHRSVMPCWAICWIAATSPGRLAVGLHRLVRRALRTLYPTGDSPGAMVPTNLAN
ncbi:MAG: serine hydrolase domain-containing protein [Burkholderiaceae bacterium]